MLGHEDSVLSGFESGWRCKEDRTASEDVTLRGDITHCFTGDGRDDIGFRWWSPARCSA
jgi:hypothetical protein